MSKEKIRNYVAGRTKSEDAQRQIDEYHHRIKRYIEETSGNMSSNNGVLKNQEVLVPEEMRTNLDLSNLDLYDEDFIDIVDDLKYLTSVTVLKLGQNRLTGDSIKLLLNAMPQLERLGLWENRLSQKNACRFLAQFPKLRTLDATNTMLHSEHLEELVSSNTLLRVHFMRNPKVDIVRRARVLAACDYNNQTLIKKSMGVKPTESKDDYIRNNLTRFVQQAKKAQDDLAAADKESVESFFRERREIKAGTKFHTKSFISRRQSSKAAPKEDVKSHERPQGKL